jgi:hypothetical protein
VKKWPNKDFVSDEERFAKKGNKGRGIKEKC